MYLRLIAKTDAVISSYTACPRKSSTEGIFSVLCILFFYNHISGDI